MITAEKRPLGVDRWLKFWYIKGTERETPMCLAIPARITRIDESRRGKVDYLGNEVKVDFTLLPQAKIGDWVIVHAGFAISLLDEKEAEETLQIFRDMAKAV